MVDMADPEPVMQTHAFDPDYEAEQNRRMMAEDTDGAANDSPHAFARRADQAATTLTAEDSLVMLVVVYLLVFLVGLLAAVGATQGASAQQPTWQFRRETELQRLVSIEHNPHQAYSWSLTPDEMKSLGAQETTLNKDRSVFNNPASLVSLLNPNTKAIDVSNHFPDQPTLDEIVIEKRGSRSDAGSTHIPSEWVQEHNGSHLNTCINKVRRVDCGHQALCNLHGTCQLAQTSCVNTYQYHDLKCSCSVGWNGKWCERAVMMSNQ